MVRNKQKYIKFFLTFFYSIYCYKRGSFITKKKPFASAAVYVIAQAAHPLTDGKVFNQAASVFEQVSSVIALQVAGATRFSAPNLSGCVTSYYEFDVAHNVDLPFHASMQQVYDTLTNSQIMPFVAIQFHGMADTTCPGTAAFLTNGILTSESSKLIALKNELRNATQSRSWPGAIGTPVDTAGQTACSLNGAVNVQGKLLNYQNSTMQLCGSASAKTNAGAFIHIEQVQQVREDYAIWVSVISKVFPTSGVAPNASSSTITPSKSLKNNSVAGRGFSILMVIAITVLLA